MLSKKKSIKSYRKRTLRKRTNKNKLTMKNAAIILISKLGAKDRFVILRDRNNHKWMIPGGNLEKGETPFQGMKREFYEEVGQELPYLEKQKSFDFPRYKTCVYVGLSNTKINFRENDEADAIHFASIDDLMSGRLFNRFEFKSYVKSTLNTLKDDIISI